LSSNYSESDYADAFEACLLSRRGLVGLEEFSAVYREVICRQGRADFVAVARDDGRMSNQSVGCSSSLKLTESAATLLSLLKLRSPRTLEYLVRRSGLTYETTKRTLRDLMSTGAVRNATDSSYLLGRTSMQPLEDLWAFELKLHDWRRALFQACQYQAFANSVCIVMPSTASRVLDRRIAVFSSMGVGLIVFDLDTSLAKVLVPPTFTKVASLQHVYYARAQLSQMTQCQ
jgi:hypothetical protein